MTTAALALAALLGAMTVAQLPPAAGQSPAATPGPASSTAAPPSPAPTPAYRFAPPSAAPTPAYRFVYRPAPPPAGPAPGAPAILEVDLTDRVIVTPTELNVLVMTTPAVVSVTAQALGHTIVLPQVQPGMFGFSTTLRAAPNSLRNRSFDVVFVAAGADGRTASLTLALTLK